jgi:hypothetical protein
MSSTSPARILIDHTYAADKHLPYIGEVIVVPLFQAFFGPGSIIGNGNGCSLPSRPHHNYHHAVVLGIELRISASGTIIIFTFLPIPSYSAIDPLSGLSSTCWLHSQPTDFQELHVPVPYKQLLHPPSPTPVEFGDPIEAGGWTSSLPSWILVVPLLSEFKTTTKVCRIHIEILLETDVDILSQFKCYEPRVQLSRDEIQRLKIYGGLPLTPTADVSSLGESTVPGSSYGGAAFGTSGSSALQALYAIDAVKEAFANLSYHCQLDAILDEEDDDEDDEDEDEEWEDNMDPVTFARYYTDLHPHFARIVQEHDDKMRERLVEEIGSWVKGVQSETQ